MASVGPSRAGVATVAVTATATEAARADDAGTRPRVADVPNPVLAGMHADPSICRVGDDYFLVTSTNEYLPGLPIYTSTDLVSWRQLGNVVTRDSQLDLTTAPSSLGLFAPALRHHDGTFYLTSTLVGSGHFLMTAEDAAGPWSDPVWIAGSGWDPSLVFVSSHGSAAGDRAFFHYSTGTSIRGFFVDLSTGTALSDEIELWVGTGGNAPEGPHLYRVGDFWYLVIAEGGTSAGHAVTVARSAALEGPYEAHPGNPVLTHRGLSSPIQAVGHADLVETSAGEWWAVVLGSRPLGGHGYQLLGRETFLVPVSWQGEPDDQWPVFGTDKRVPLTTGFSGNPVSAAFADDFVADTLDPGWLFIRTAEPPFARVGDGELVLTPTASTLDDPETPAFVGRRQSTHGFFAQVEVRLGGLALELGGSAVEAEAGRAVTADLIAPAAAGLAARRDERHHYHILLVARGGTRYVEVIARIGDLSQQVGSAPTAAPSVQLRIRAVPNRSTNPLEGSGLYEFAFRESARGEWRTLASLDSRYLSTEVAAGFTGTVIGMYAENGISRTNGERASISSAAHFSGWRSGDDSTHSPLKVQKETRV
ncbi:glycoside hydrolase family 43 protein [Subtercola boreus]|uniref:glycoside hydrolase family 43 protein n=1 Tax=Subtercola boreus TaxID=120213 RepID=UPI001559727E|nr:glycoside hydrolase family 43 protein [Subtercola boreus]